MFRNIVKIAKENWIFFAIAIVVALFLFFMKKRENYYDYEITGCSTCSAGDAGVIFDSELTGCSTCSAGDAGVLIDNETENTEIINMPDGYYETPMEVADTIAEVAHNPDTFEAVVEDREDEVYEDGEDDTVIIDPTDYAAQSDDQLVKDFYGDAEIDYKERERIHKVRFAPIEFLENDGAFTLL